MNNKWFRITAILLVIIFALAGCSSKPPEDANSKPETGAKSSSKSGAKVTLNVFNTAGEKPVQEILKQIAAQYEQENLDIAVNLSFPGADYENIMKVKMAANDLPDVFDTHGWSVIRYGKYLADLRDEAWASQMSDTIKNVVTNKEGKVHTLVLSEAKDGLTYNIDLLKKYNIEPPKTFDELIAAGEKIKKESNGKTVPFFFSGIDDWLIGQYFDYFATSLLISPKDNSADALLNNTFDWNKWTPLPAKFLDMKKKGLMNADVLTAKYSDLPQAFAEEKVAFTLLGPSFVDEVHKINPNLKIGFMPVPAMVAGDEPSFSGGERYTMGAWKDSKNLAEAKKLIAFFAKKENMEKIAAVTKLPAGLKGINAKHEFSEYYDKFANVRVFPYFDRVYLPNGMWDVMTKTGTELLAERVTPDQYSQTMKKEVERLRNQK